MAYVRTWVWVASYAPTGRATCKKCKMTIVLGAKRLSREIPFSLAGDGYTIGHYHMRCGLEAARVSRCMTRHFVVGGAKVLTPPPELKNDGLSKADLAAASKTFATIRKEWIARCKKESGL